MLEGAAHLGCEVGEERVDLAEIKGAGDALSSIAEDRGQIIRECGEQRRQVIGTVFEVDSVGIDRYCARASSAKASTNMACAVQIGVVAGQALPPVAGAQIGLSTCLAWAMVYPSVAWVRAGGKLPLPTGSLYT